MTVIQLCERAATLFKLYGLDKQAWRFEIRRGRRSLGMCQWGSRIIWVAGEMLDHCDDEEIEQTLLHEIAHALCDSSVKHGKKWKTVARNIGVKELKAFQRLTPGNHIPRKYNAKCSKCGQEYGRMRMNKWVGTAFGPVYRCKYCNTRIHFQLGEVSATTQAIAANSDEREERAPCDKQSL